MTQSLQQLALEAVKKDPLYGMDSWRPIPHLESDIVLRNEPERLDLYVEKVLGSAQLSWKLQGRAIGTTHLFCGWFKVDQKSPGLIARAFIEHFRKVQFWTRVFQDNQWV